MPIIRIKDNEPLDIALRRFRRICEKSGIYSEMRSREYYEKPAMKRKRLLALALKRHWKRILRENPFIIIHGKFRKTKYRYVVSTKIRF